MQILKRASVEYMHIHTLHAVAIKLCDPTINCRSPTALCHSARSLFVVVAAFGASSPQIACVAAFLTCDYIKLFTKISCVMPLLSVVDASSAHLSLAFSCCIHFVYPAKQVFLIKINLNNLRGKAIIRLRSLGSECNSFCFAFHFR